MIGRPIMLSGVATIASFLFAPSAAQAACNPLSLCICAVSASGMSFGNYDPISGAHADTTGTVRVACTLTVALTGSYTVSLSAGNSGSYSARHLRNGSNTLSYNLFTTSARSIVWGDGTGGSSSVTQNFLALLFVENTLTIYGRIPGGQNVPAGTYNDTITVTVTY